MKEYIKTLGLIVLLFFITLIIFGVLIITKASLAVIIICGVLLVLEILGVIITARCYFNLYKNMEDSTKEEQ